MRHVEYYFYMTSWKIFFVFIKLINGETKNENHIVSSSTNLCRRKKDFQYWTGRNKSFDDTAFLYMLKIFITLKYLPRFSLLIGLIWGWFLQEAKMTDNSRRFTRSFILGKRRSVQYTHSSHWFEAFVGHPLTLLVYLSFLLFFHKCALIMLEII